jgi:hypothetical protein
MNRRERSVSARRMFGHVAEAWDFATAESRQSIESKTPESLLKLLGARCKMLTTAKEHPAPKFKTYLPSEDILRRLTM